MRAPVAGGAGGIRTLLFSSLYPSSVRPGFGIFVETRLRHLLASGQVETRVVAPVPWFPSTHPRFGMWAKNAATPRHEVRNGVEIWHPRYLLPPKVGMNIAPLALALGARSTVAKLIEDGFDFDLIDAHYYYPDGVAAAILASWFGKPFIITARGSDLTLLPEYPIPRCWIRWAEPRAAASIGVCRDLMDRLVRLGGRADKTHVFRNGVDLERFTPHDPAAARQQLGMPDGRIFLSVGNLVELKGHHISIEAMKRFPDARLFIVGEGGERASLQALAVQHDVADRVTFAGARPQSELSYWYSAADALVLCSSREGWANVLLESMACGTPVVATALGGTPEVVQSPDAGRLMADRSVDALVNALGDLFAAYPSRQAVRAYAEQFDWAETTRCQLALFKQIMGGRAAADPTLTA
ncbi:glycosyltransferase family 4 protein [Zoogloea sp.]|uniref:glycosyltransferase family 4 protein n=1 Tax=Zoogloea sp. TaxID=49181 RepID=UPI00263617FE|nr:glycosyltransferase family 4 protein [uncultured Zoogloea sp.]